MGEIKDQINVIFGTTKINVRKLMKFIEKALLFLDNMFITETERLLSMLLVHLFRDRLSFSSGIVPFVTHHTIRPC